MIENEAEISSILADSELSQRCISTRVYRYLWKYGKSKPFNANPVGEYVADGKPLSHHPYPSHRKPSANTKEGE